MKAIQLFIFNIIFLILSCEDNYFIKIGDKTFPFTLKDTTAANELKQKLPLKLQMTKLNDNELYYQFSNEHFTTNTKNVGTINIGDIYLYQSNILVLFYKTFSTSYSYSDLGKLVDTSGLVEAIGSSSPVLVEWCLNSCDDNNENSNSSNTDTITEKDNPTSDITTVTDDDTNETFGNYKSNYNFINVNYFIYSLILFIFI